MAFFTVPPVTTLGLQAAGDAGSDPFESIAAFFESSTWNLAVFAFRAFAVVFWLALVWWTFQDARRRSANVGFIALAVLLSLLIPFLGTLVYLVIRPPEYLLEARERELELIALERRLGDMGDHEGQEIVGRLLGRDPDDTAIPKNRLRDAGVASRDDLQDVEIRLTELEFRIRDLLPAPDSAARSTTTQRPRARGADGGSSRSGQSTSDSSSRSSDEPSSSSTSSSQKGSPSPGGDKGSTSSDEQRTTIRRMRRTLRSDPEASN